MLRCIFKNTYKIWVWLQHLIVLSLSISLIFNENFQPPPSSFLRFLIVECFEHFSSRKYSSGISRMAPFSSNAWTHTHTHIAYCIMFDVWIKFASTKRKIIACILCIKNILKLFEVATTLPLLKSHLCIQKKKWNIGQKKTTAFDMNIKVHSR